MTPTESVDFDAPQRLKAQAFLVTSAYMKQQERCDWQHCNPLLMKWAARVVRNAHAIGVPLYVHSAFRTEAEQNEIFRRKVSKVRFPYSAHNIGEAVDIVHGIYHWDLTPYEWKFIYTIGERTLRSLNSGLPKAEHLDLNWGGPESHKSDKFTWDPAHWEISDYRLRTRKLTAGAPLRRTPSAILIR